MIKKLQFTKSLTYTNNKPHFAEKTRTLPLRHEWSYDKNEKSQFPLGNKPRIAKLLFLSNGCYEPGKVHLDGLNFLWRFSWTGPSKWQLTTNSFKGTWIYFFGHVRNVRFFPFFGLLFKFYEKRREGFINCQVS